LPPITLHKTPEGFLRQIFRDSATTANMSWDEEDLGAFTAKSHGPDLAFDDENVAHGESGGVKENWDDEDEPVAPVADTQKSFPKVSSKKAAGKQKARKEERKKAELEASQPSRALSYEEKKALEEQVKSSDFGHAVELFKDVKVDDDNAALFGPGEPEQDKEIKLPEMDFKPSTAKDFTRFASLVGSQLAPYKESYHYLAFLKDLLKEATSQCDAEEIKELIAQLNVIANDKIKAANTKKKKAPKKTTVKKEAVFEDMVDEDEYAGFRM